MPFRTPRRDQAFLLPASIDEWIAADHPARFVWVFVQELDMAALGITAVASPLGAPSYPPDVLLACWLYGFMDHKRSSRSLERACRESLPYLWLAGLLQPDHVTLWRFYDANRAVLGDLFRQTVHVAVEAGLVDFALQCVDGSKIAVCSADKLRQREALEKLLARVEAEIAAMEEGQEEPPKESARRHKAQAKKEDLSERVHRAMAHIAEQEQSKQSRQRKKPTKPVAYVADPEARLMKTRHGWKVGYNAQAVVDGKSQIIVAADVCQHSYDTEQLIPLLEQVRQAYGHCATATLADNGYFSAKNLIAAAQHTDLYLPDVAYEKLVKGSHSPYHASKFEYRPAKDVYICPQGKPLTFLRPTRRSSGGGTQGRQYQCEECEGCPVRTECTRSSKGRTLKRMENQAVLQAHRDKMAKESARVLLKRRGPLIEAVFGILKECQGAGRFLMRGLLKVKQEWYLLCAALNLRKLYQYWVAQRNQAQPA